MPTKKKRLNLTLPKHVAVYLKQISMHEEVSQSQKAVELIEQAIELTEDMYFAKIADERRKNSKGYISHEEFWKGLV